MSVILRTSGGYPSYSTICLESTVAGAPFFFAVEEGDGVGSADVLSSGVVSGVDEGEGASSDAGVGDAEDFRFFFRLGLGDESGVSEVPFFFFGDGDGDASGSSSTVDAFDVLFRFVAEGEGDFSGGGEGFATG